MLEELLYQEVDRIYWDAYPTAPATIDPNDPDHQQWVHAWNEIKHAIWSNAPAMDLPPATYDDLDTSYLKADLMSACEDYKRQVYGDLWPFLDAYVEARIAAAVELVQTGQLGPNKPADDSVTTIYWPEQESFSHTEQKMSVVSNVWFRDGVLRGNFTADITNPRT